MTELDFGIIQTGGGCEALEAYSDSGYRFWITNEDGCSVPGSGDKAMLGIYSNFDEDMTEPVHMETYDDLEKALNAAEASRWSELGTVSPYLLQYRRTELEAALDVDPGHPVPCRRCEVEIPADETPEGCRDPRCPRKEEPYI